MFIVHHRLADSLIEERLARAERARVLAQLRQLRKGRQPQVPSASSPEAEIVELAFGCHCEAEQLGA